MKRLIAGILIIGIIISGSVLLARRTKGATGTLVEIGTARKGAFQVTVSCSGEIRSVKSLEIRSAVTGTIERILAQEGDQVKKGQDLLVFDTRDLSIQLNEAKAAVAGAEADLAELSLAPDGRDPQVEQARARLASAMARLQDVESGPSKSQIAQAKASLDEASVALSEARKSLEVTKALFAEGAVAKNTLDEAASKVKTAEARHRAAKEQYEELLKGPDEADIAIAKAEVKEAKTALAAAQDAERDKTRRRYAAEMRLKQMKASLSAIQARIAAAIVKSGIDGVVANMLVKEGQQAQEGMLLMNILDLSRLLVEARVDEVDIPKVRPGQWAVITVDAVPGTEFRGKIVKISPTAVMDGSVPKFKVDIELEGGAAILKPGMGADAEITVYQRKDAILVPSQAIVEREVDRPEAHFGGASSRLRKVVFKIEGDRVREVPVKVGMETALDVEILDGVSAGDKIVIGDYRALKNLKDGDRIRAKQENKSGAAKQRSGLQVGVAPS
ncbi:MAG: efflux RND transporter periplasmic adaptor subunit [Firmicutes bacterium]|nr:efflux RND transporter periplasmic adaptor subunit [Bacillota bacterium]